MDVVLIQNYNWLGWQVRGYVLDVIFVACKRNRDMTTNKPAIKSFIFIIAVSFTFILLIYEQTSENSIYE